MRSFAVMCRAFTVRRMTAGPDGNRELAPRSSLRVPGQRLNGGCRFDLLTFGGLSGNAEDAPTAVIG